MGGYLHKKPVAHKPTSRERRTEARLQVRESRLKQAETLLLERQERLREREIAVAQRESELAEAIRQQDEAKQEEGQDYQDIEFRHRGKERSSYSKRPVIIRVWMPHSDFYLAEYEGRKREQYRQSGGDAYGFKVVATGRKVRS